MSVINVLRAYMLMLAMIILTGCGSSDGSDSSNEPIPVFNVATRPLLDDGNLHPNFRTQDGECLVADCTSATSATISQFKQDVGYVGFPFGLRSGSGETIDIDPNVVESLSVYSGPMATYTAKHSPVAVRQGDYTYFVFTGPAAVDQSNRFATASSAGSISSTQLFARSADGEFNATGVYLSRYNHVSNKVSKPILMHLKHIDDPHDNAVLNFDNQGDLYVLVAGRGLIRGAVMYYINSPDSHVNFDAEALDIRDISPDSIDYSSLGDVGVLTSDVTPISYPKLIKIDDGFRLVYNVYCYRERAQQCRFGTRQLWAAKLNYSRNIDDIATLSDVRPMAAFGGHYAMAVGSESGQDIAVAFNVIVNGQTSNRTNLYVLYSNDFGATWRYIDRRNGERRSAESILPVSTERELNQIATWQLENYDNSITQRVYLKDIQLKGQGDNLNPQILVVRSEGSHGPVTTNSHFLTLVTPGSRGWETQLLTTEIDHNYSTGFISQKDEQDSRVFFPGVSNSLNNGLAGGVPAYLDVERGASNIFVNYLTIPRVPRTNNYLTGLCEINYIRAALFARGDEFVGIASASNPYRFEADSSSQYRPASPLYIFNQDGSLLRLPMILEEVDENGEMPTQTVPTGAELSCDSSSL